MSFVVIPRPQRRPSRFLQVVAALLGGLVLFFLFAGLVAGGYELLFSGRIFPGVSMAGVDLSSMTPEQASAALKQRLTYPISGKVVFKAGNQVWVATPAQVGMAFDAGTSVQRAYGLGRRGGPLISLASQLNAWQGGLELAPIIILDERVAHDYLQNIATQINQPVVEADLHLEGTQVIYTPGQSGRMLNVDKTLAQLLVQLNSFRDGEVPLIVEEQTPLVLDASTQAESLRQALSAALTLTITDAQPGDPPAWTIDPPALAGMFAVGRVQTDTGWQYQISFEPQDVEQYLGQIAPKVNQAPQNARYYFDDATSQLAPIQPATTGRTLDIAATLDAVTKGLLQGAHTIPLVVRLALPAVGNDATAASLGITGLVKNGAYTSYFRGSSSARMQNIQTAAEQFDGLLIPPDSTFSMGEAIGPITLENHYAEALIIYNGQTITDVGGGVCQVSTTLFRTAYFSGYPIVERHAHDYRVYYYEETAAVGVADSNLAGLDATVYFPLVDFKFKNDRPYWLLMRTIFDPDNYSLTWEFYSGDDGRMVEWQNLGLKNIVAMPDPVFEENPLLEPGKISQDDWWYEDGANITVTRSVARGGQVLFTDSTQTHYAPHPYVCQYGPGTDNPEALAAQLGLCR